jgi:hypothetical protein
VNRADAAHQSFLHQRHREPDGGLVELLRAVVDVLDVVRHATVELPLVVGHLDGDGVDLAVGEDALAVLVVEVGLPAANHDAVDRLLRKFPVLGDEERVDVLDERAERLALAVVWGRAEEQQRVRVARDRLHHVRRLARGVAALGGLVGLVDDGHVPERVL